MNLSHHFGGWGGDALKLSQETHGSVIVHKEENLELIVSLFRSKEQQEAWYPLFMSMQVHGGSLASHSGKQWGSTHDGSTNFTGREHYCSAGSQATSLNFFVLFFSSWWVTISLGIFKWCSWVDTMYYITSISPAWDNSLEWVRMETKEIYYVFFPQVLKLENCMIRILLQKSHSDSPLESNKTRGSQEA